MPRYVVLVHETVEATYRVEADSLEQAREKCSDVASIKRALDEGVEQIAYEAFEAQVHYVCPSNLAG